MNDNRPDLRELLRASIRSTGEDPDQALARLRREHAQTKVDSFLEASANIAVGFVVSWAVLDWIIVPLFNLSKNAGTTFLITCVMTVTSLLRQYILRRLFNGRNVGQVIVKKMRPDG